VPPSDADIERGLRERAVSGPRAAEILLGWLQRPTPITKTPGVDPEAMSETQLESLHAGLVKIAALPSREAPLEGAEPGTGCGGRTGGLVSVLGYTSFLRLI
jgi:hypothetical protein